jgi:putative nucleotidyltransferase with HDIG domain
MSTSVQAAAALKNLPPFPPVAAEVMALLREESVSFREVADKLNTDAALSAEVLRLANSSLLGPQFEVRSIRHAVSMLGMRRLTGLVLTLSMSRFLKRAGFQAILRRCWRHNLATALAAKEFAHSFGSDEDDAYNAGLFHDVGRLAFLVLEPALYRGPASTEDDLRELERERFGVDHCEAGAWLLEQWKLPQTFVDVARYHHAPRPEGGELAMLVNAACVIANRLGFYVVKLESEEAELDLSDELGSAIAETINSLELEYGI